MTMETETPASTKALTSPTTTAAATSSAAASTAEMTPLVPSSSSSSPSSPTPTSLATTPVQFLTVGDLSRRLEIKLDTVNPRQSLGLTSDEAATRRARDGPNILTPPKELPGIIKYLLHFADPFMLLLILAGTLAFIASAVDSTVRLSKWVGPVLYIVVFLSSTFSYFQSDRASAVMNGFKKMLPKQCHVIRDGRLMDMPASELVVGDVVRVGTGDQCPADLRLIYCNDLKVEASSLTGESVPVTCTTTSTEKRQEEAKNLIWNSCQCLEGEAVGVVFATGDRTLIGRIASMATQTSHTDSTLQREVRMFVYRLVMFACFLGLCFFIIGSSRGLGALYSFLNGFIIVLIACVPEGLPVTLVIILTITGKRLAERSVFVKQLSSVETLGSTTVIASDKTGTLTQNKMSVSRLWFDFTPFTVDTVYRDLGPSTLTMNPELAAQFGKPAATLRALERVCAVCSRTRFDDHRDLTDEEARAMDQHQALRSLDSSMTMRSAKVKYPKLDALFDTDVTITSAKRAVMSAERDDSKRNVIGDASETALFNFIRARQSIELARYHNRMVFEVPFNSRNKYALTIMKPHNIAGNRDHRRVLLMKGAPEIILERCNRYMLRGEEVPIDDEFRAEFTKAYETFGGFGERVLGFAHEILDEKQYPPEMDNKYNQKEENYPTRNLVFIGLISLIDPPKETVPPSIAMCRTAGVRVMMVTGDHPLTAAAIARQVGIITTNTRDELAKVRQVPPEQIPEEEVQAVVVRGTDLDSYSQQDWDRVLSKPEVVFARTTPAQKLQIVENLQRLKNVVAVTGDGVNDSPALKKADIGCAMGISGSDVARDAADIVLMNDDFSSIVIGIQEGRTIFDNLSKTIAYTVTHLIPEVLPTLLNLSFGIPLGVSSILILCIDLGTDVAPAISLAYEKAESNVMNRPPRNANTDHLVTAKTVAYWFCVAGAVETLTCFLAFFLVFNYHGIGVEHMSFIDSYFNPLKDNSDGNWFCPGGWGDRAVCTTAYGASDPDSGYSPDEQTQILREAQTAYWTMLSGSQVFHIFMCKTRELSIFKHGWFDNVNMNFAVLLEIALILLVVFVPAHGAFQTEIFPGRFWSIVLVGWGSLFVVNEARKWAIRNHPDNIIVRALTW